MRAPNAASDSGAAPPAPESGAVRLDEATRGGGGHTRSAHRLSEMTWPEVAEAVRAGCTTVILPLGATEQHGPHLPLGTDAIRAAALADRLAERLPGSLVAPALPFGCSDEHWGFPGLLGLDAETFARVILDLARRVVGWGMERLVLLSAHGGNGDALDLTLELLGRELPDLEVRTNGNLESVAPAALEMARREGISASDLGLHAGEGETSEMLHLRPELAHPQRAALGFTGDMETILDDLRAGGLRSVTANGVLGDPTRAAADRGARYLDAFADELAAALRRDADAS
ncbi:mycofactocin biosynthesis peptidyl-dipeptidase MftE [Rubrobacter marinus]|uniref:Mycofactocin biosynthesis peptidyl-dipeptidase MftE n=1 Tax=Rubrobacter marinus TaxID=2653852 RepID=A0A6G8Q1Z9_9ACTN|nr:mycofactocin biosynthesis peptidyl-dipeptidase MftE [Rubrobacter marinus]QIN80489.1 mycofactocin biosynthesis peptidyl-dipeptidase MftE [Rubrobacter marinus]